MPISVDWATKIITVQFVDLEWVQDIPTVIRKLDINVFRLALKALEASDEGMSFLDTHRHNTEVSLGGLTFARVVEIINGYTVTFEDGQYAVNLYGANHNVADVANVNQVSIRPSNSAGLISSPAIEYASFQNGVWLDETSSATGTLYNVGTPENPVNNLTDAKLIAVSRGFRTIYIIGNYDFEASDNIDGFSIIGENEQHTSISVASGCSTVNVRFEEVEITTGVLSGTECCFHHCELGDVSGIQGTLWNCILSGNIKLAGTSSDLVMMISCYLGSAFIGLIEIDMNGDGPHLAMRAYTGGVRIINKSGAAKVAIDFVSGRLELMDTVTAGTFFIRGVGEITVNEATGITLNDNSLINPAVVADAVEASDSVSTILSYVDFVKEIEGGKWEISGGQMIFYKDDNITEIARFDLTYDVDGNPVMRVRV